MKGRETYPRLWRLVGWDCLGCSFRMDGKDPPKGRCPKCTGGSWEPVRVRMPIQPFVKTELREG